MNVHNQIDRFLNKNSSEKHASWRNYLKIVRTTLAHAQCSCAATAALRSFRPVRSLVVWGGKGGEEDDRSAVECVEVWGVARDADDYYNLECVEVRGVANEEDDRYGIRMPDSGP
jgi:hypothetical protein